MLSRKNILLGFVIWILVSVITGLLYYMSNNIMSSIVIVPLSEQYAYRVSFVGCIEIGFFTCALAYIIYRTLLLFSKRRVSLIIKIPISIFSYGIIFILYASDFGQKDFLQPFMIKNIIVFLCPAIITPFFENFFFTKSTSSSQNI